MRNESKTRWLTVLALFGLAGCQYVPFLRHAERVKPAATATATAMSAVGPYAAEDRLYEHAVKALEQRDYGLALDVLQMAREARPDDPRVLSAMGVVYDKLGRFDLSARYYDLAEKADPGSRVVAADRAYSQLLQRGGGVVDGVVVMSRLDAGTTALSLIGPEPMNVQQAALFTKVIQAGVRIRNATGKAEGADRIKAHLTLTGWTVARTSRLEPKRVAVSNVVYPAGVFRVAKALARSLPYPVKLKACADCSQLQVLVGQDALPGLSAARAVDTRRG